MVALLLPAVVLSVVVLLARSRRRPALVALVPVLAVAAAFAEPPDPGVSREPFHTGELSGMGGSYATCSGTNRYAAGGGRYRYTAPVSDRVEGWAEGAASYGAVYADMPSAETWSLTAMGGLDHRWAGAGLGLVTGHLYAGDRYQYVPGYPAASLRLGPRDVAFLQASLARHSPTSFPAPVLQIGAGFALRRVGNVYQPLVVRAGISDAGFYLEPAVGFGGRFSTELFVSYADGQTWNGSLALRIHAPRRHR